MSKLKEDFTAARKRLDYREIASTPMSNAPGTQFKELRMGQLDLSVSPATDALPYAAIIWNKDADTFGIVFSDTDQYLEHRVRVHFYHDGYEPVKTSQAFMNAAEVLEALPQLADRNYSVSPRASHIIESLTYAQLDAVVAAAHAVNKSRAEMADHLRHMDESLKLTLGNAFTEQKSAPLPAPAAAHKPKAAGHIKKP